MWKKDKRQCGSMALGDISLSCPEQLPSSFTASFRALVLLYGKGSAPCWGSFPRQATALGRVCGRLKEVVLAGLKVCSVDQQHRL